MKDIARKLLNRLGRTISGPADNFSEQFLYGHREIFIAYSGISQNIAIRGSVEHGWSPFGPSLGVPKFTGGRYLHLAWSSQNQERSGFPYPRNVRAVGAPFLYLVKMFPKVVSLRRDESRKYLFFPPHGTEDDSPAVELLIKHYAERFDPKKSTVQLFWTEFLKPNIREAYEMAGFSVCTAGFSGVSLNLGLGIAVRERAMSTLGGRNLFLLRTISQIQRHQEVVSGSFGTSTLYAGFMKKKVNLLKEWNSYRTVYMDDRDKYSGHNELANSPFNQYVSRQIVPFHFSDQGISLESFHTYASQELGEEDLLEKAELAELILANSFEIRAKTPVDELLSELKKLEK